MSEISLNSETCHGTCVAINDLAVLLVGASGAGKSATALDLVSRGGVLVADDQVVLRRDGAGILASCPSGFEGQIEARGIGILQVASQAQAKVVLVVDLDQTELQRLPPARKQEILGVDLDLIYGRDNLHLSAGIWAFLHGSRIA